jgi:LysR family glycine cleavage system transcriptional activator
VTASSHLRSFQALAVAIRTGSLKAAADELSITPAAVGQRIKALEDYLGMELLVRGRAGLRPAPELFEAAPRIEAAFRELDAAAEILELQRGHEIHIAAPSDFVELWLRHRLDAFRRIHPHVLFCVNAEGEAAYRVGRVDCEISFGPVRGDSQTELLFRDYLVPISSPENARRFAGVVERDEIEGVPLLHLDFYRNDPAAGGWFQWIKAEGLTRTAPERGVRFHRIAPALDAVLSNAGLLICGLALISDLVDDGRIAVPYPTSQGFWTEHGFQARFTAAHARPQMNRFRRWLVEEARATSAWLSRTAGQSFQDHPREGLYEAEREPGR